MKKKILVFGASGALGRGVCESLLLSDYDEYYFFDRNETIFVSNKLINNVPITDLANPDNVRIAFEKVKIAKDDKVFLVSTIGGFFGGNPVWETEPGSLQKMFQVNFNTNYFILQQFALLVKQCSGGGICFTSAFTSLYPEAGKLEYGAAKAALNYLVQSASIEGRGIKLSVNAIAPFIIDTPANKSWLSDAGIDSGTVMKPKEIGELVHSLFSHYRFVSGNVIELGYRFP